MKQAKKSQMSWWLAGILALPFLDYALLRLIVLSFLENKLETGLFLIFYLQFVPQEIVLRRILGKKRDRPWYYWAGWICRWAWILMIALSIVHLMMGYAWEGLLAPDLYQSGLWMDQALLPLRWIFSISGIAVMLIRKETRKKALIHSAIAFSSMFLGLGIANRIYPLKNNPSLSNLLANCFLFLIPHLHGLGGALFWPLFGKKAQKEDAARKAVPVQALPRRPAPVRAAVPQPSPQKANPQKASPQMPKTAAAQTAPPRDAEQELAERKAAYEARMRRMAAASKKELDRISVDELLEKTAVRLFYEGRAAAALGGQRQLIYWMAQAVPRLNGLIRQPMGKRFFAPALPDDPDAFKPLLDSLLTEAARLLESKDASTNQDAGRSADPEALCAGWYALTRFAAVRPDGSVFLREAEALKARFKKEKPLHAWLKSAYESAEERDPK